MQLVYLSPVPWATFAQRPHKFVEWFHSRSGGKVLWVDPYPTRLPELSDFRRVKAAASGSEKTGAQTQIPGWLEVIHPRALPIEPVVGSGVVNRLFWANVLKEVEFFVKGKTCYLAIGKPSELALQILDQHPELQSLYDAMDDIAAFYRGFSSSAMKRTEEKIASRVTRLLVSSTALANRFSRNVPKPTLVHNACAGDMLPPIGEVRADHTQQVLGYVGTIASWFDWPLVIALAAANPSSLVRLVGPLYVPPPVPLPANIELMPACSHEAAIKVMQTFSLGLIPFRINALTSSVDPVKYYEYRALGLPVASTPFGEMSLRGNQKGVLLLEKHGNLENLLEQGALSRPTENEIEGFRCKNTWEVRFDAAKIF